MAKLTKVLTGTGTGTERKLFALSQIKDINLKNFAIGSVARLLFEGDGTNTKGQEQQYLHKYYLSLRNIENWGHELKRYLWNPCSKDATLIELANKLDLSHIELLATVLALAVEEDPMAGRAMAYIQSPVGGSRPTLGLLESALAFVSKNPNTPWIAGTIVSGNAIRTGVLTIINDNVPIPEQAIKIPNALALALRQQTFNLTGTSLHFSNDWISLPDSIAETAKHHAASLENTINSVLVIRSASKKEARTVANIVSQQLKQKPVFTQPDLNQRQWLGPLCLIKKLIPVFEYDLAPGEQKSLPELPGYDGSKIVIMGLDGNIDAQSGSVLNWTIPAPSKKERKKLWESYLGDERMAQYMADNHVHSAGRIMELSQLALRQAKLNRRTAPGEEDIRQAVWSAEEGALGSLAQPIATRISDEALVLSKRVKEELDQLLSRCRHRETLAEDLGVTIKARYQMGVRTLFIGPSGTGKTLVASWLATKLGLPLYRVDLASVVSKYIGETEKNLATLLAKAEQAEIVLLFDEADSLFGKRTEIKDSNDRFANSQTNYLLQRIEFYKGIVLLTSNSRGRFDAAFTRRLDKIIDFPLPGPEERRALWQTHLGDAHDLSIRQLNQLAVTSDLAGGQIRNAVLTGAVRAHAEARPIGFDDVLAGLAGEYSKVGRQIPAELMQYQGKK